MSSLESALQGLAAIDPGGTLQVIIAAVALVFSVIVLLPGLRTLASSVREGEVDWGTVLLIGVIAGVASGLLWAFVTPFKIVPPYIHLRLFAFLPPLVGMIFGWRAGFISGYVATWVWALLAGAFVPLHTPIVDGIFVGLTGALPVLVLRSGVETSPEQKEGWFGRALMVGLATGLFMSVFVAVSLELTTPLPFWLSFWAIGVISDTLPIMLGLAILTPVFQRATRTMTWAVQH
jgi:hypothetical protein